MRLTGPSKQRMGMNLAAKLAIGTLVALVLLAGGPKLARAEENDSVEAQKARAKRVESRASRVFYTHQFNLDDLPHYQPKEKVSGTIRMWGSNYFSDSPLAGYWEKDFQKYQPNIKFAFHLKTSEHAISGLNFGVSDIGPMGRQIMWDELMGFQREFSYLPLGIVAVTGSYDVSGWNAAIGIFVHQDNPISKLTLKQVDGIFGAERSGAWKDLIWDESLARGPESNIRKWGQLGLTGEWADKPIHVYGYNLQFHFPQEIESRAFGGVSSKWNENLREYANKLNADGSVRVAGLQMMEDLSKDPYGIAYVSAGTVYLTPTTKPVALAASGGGPYFELNLENVRNRTYPIYADVFFYVNRDPKKPIDPKVKEFLRYILSREGQEQVMRDGKYLPLTAAAVREQLKKLD
jgi:phosphate transport system substrate-binding protein